MAKKNKHSKAFNKMFSFFFWSCRKDILSFPGEEINIHYDPNGDDAKKAFKKFKNGEYKYNPPITKHPNVLRNTIIGKKSWGLHVSIWTEGINEFTFTRDELLSQFPENDIELPPQLEKEFDNVISKKRQKRLELEHTRLIENGYLKS